MFKQIALASFVATTISTVALAETFSISGDRGSTIMAEVLETFDSPWAMTWLPDGHAS